jgi:hypothetical protein
MRENMGKTEPGKRSIVRKSITALFALAITTSTMANAANISLNVKDSGNTDKFVVMDSGFVGIGNKNPKTAVFAEGYDTSTSQIQSHVIFPTDPSIGNHNLSGGFISSFNYMNNGLPLAGDRLGYYLFASYDTDGATGRNAAGMAAKAEQNWVSGLNGSTLSMPAYLTLETTDVTGSRLERVRITAAGNVGIGTTTPGTYKLNVAGDVYTTGLWISSDAKLKKNVKTIDSALDKVVKMNGVQYEFNRENFVVKNLPQGKHFGVIAQELENVMPEAVKVDEDGTRSVAYAEIIPVLIEAIKAQQKEIELLKQKVK